MKNILFLAGCCLLPFTLRSQGPEIYDSYLAISARGDDPLYTTYAAPMERSRMYGDKAYKMDYYSGCEPLHFRSDQAGKLYNTWRFNAVVVDRMEEYFRKPVVIASFPDLALLDYEPWQGIKVRETFMVYSSSIAMADLFITNTGPIAVTIDIYPVLELGNDSLLIVRYDQENNTCELNHYETKKRLISNLRADCPYPTHVRDLLCGGFQGYSHGGYSGGMDDFYNAVKRDFYAEKDTHDSLNCITGTYVNIASLHSRFTLKPGESRDVRYFRGEQDQSEDAGALQSTINELKYKSIQQFLDQDTKLFGRVPRIDFRTKAEKLVYLGALNLARGCMYPPSGKTSYNFYAFSRNPLWGWGHGHQVLHESLSMMAYAYLDPFSARNSQRVYMEQQGPDGLIAYRHGPRGAQDYPHKGKPTTSAPFFSWINWEVYKTDKDRKFLEEAYASGSKYVNWLLANRDEDKDGTLEWGPYGIIENVRDWYNAVFQVSAERYLDVDKEDISDELECLDLTLMVIKEMRCLSQMAGELGDKAGSSFWKNKADSTSLLVNQRMWDEATGFYYSVNKKDHSFRFMTRDLKRQEIIGFLALWAEAAPKDRAERLVKTLADPSKFWRQYGVPTLAADDAWYSPYVDYCCKWNGPVWLLWDYMVYDGLKNYGYKDLARQLADKMMLAVTTQLSANHNFWESFSPDNAVLNCPPNYIWDSIMARLLAEEYK